MQNVPFKVGNVEFPLTASTANPLLKDADPALYYALDFFYGVIIEHLNDRWLSQTALAQRVDGYIINQVVPYNPIPYLSDTSYRFPLLSLYETESQKEYHTKVKYHIDRKMELMFLLPPLSADQVELLHPFLKAIDNVVTDRLLEGLDTNYQNGLTVWQQAGIEKISVGQSTISTGKVPSIALPFQCLVIQIDWKELRQLDTNAFPYAFTNMDGYVYQPDGTTEVTFDTPSK